MRSEGLSLPKGFEVLEHVSCLGNNYLPKQDNTHLPKQDAPAGIRIKRNDDV